MHTLEQRFKHQTTALACKPSKRCPFSFETFYLNSLHNWGSFNIVTLWKRLYAFPQAEKACNVGWKSTYEYWKEYEAVVLE